MNPFQKELKKILTTELSQKNNSKEGGAIGNIVGRLAGKIMPLVFKHGPKLLASLGLAAASGAISGATHKAVTGKGMTGDYVEYGLMLTDGQKYKLRNAKGAITIRLSKSQLTGNDKLLLTKTQINKIIKAQRSGVGMDLKLSQTQLQKQGGFLGALAAGLLAPMIGKMVGLGKGIQLPGTKRGRGRQKKL